MRREKIGNPGGVSAVPLHPQGQRLDPPEHEPAITRTGHGADGVLQVRQAVVQIGVVYHDRPPDHIGVTVEILGRGVDDGCGAELERILQRGCGERVVYPDWHACLLRFRNTRRYVHDSEQRIRRGFQPDHSGLRAKCLLQRSRFLQGNKCRFDSGRRLQDVFEQPVGAAIDIVSAHDVVAGLQQVPRRGMGAGSTGKGQSVSPALERSKA